MLTDLGKVCLSRYLAKYSSDFISHLCVGVGETSESNTDKFLSLQVLVQKVEMTSLDQQTNKLFYKATLPSDLECDIYEVGALCRSGLSSDSSSSEVFFDFNLSKESWSTGTTSSNARVSEGLLVSGSSSVTSTLVDFLLNLSFLGAGSKIKFGVTSDNNCQSISLRLGTDSLNYYERTFSSIISGYQVLSVDFESMSKVGAPDLEKLSFCQVVATPKPASTMNVVYDIIAIDDSYTYPSGDILVSRKVLPTPVIKTAGTTLEIQYELDIT